MSQAKPCPFCGYTTFCYLPNIAVPLHMAGTLLGMRTDKHVTGEFWTATLVICNGCGYVQTFTQEAARLMQVVPGAQQISVPRTGG